MFYIYLLITRKLIRRKINYQARIQQEGIILKDGWLIVELHLSRDAMIGLGHSLVTEDLVYRMWEFHPTLSNNSRCSYHGVFVHPRSWTCILFENNNLATSFRQICELSLRKIRHYSLLKNKTIASKVNTFEDRDQNYIQLIVKDSSGQVLPVGNYVYLDFSRDSLEYIAAELLLVGAGLIPCSTKDGLVLQRVTPSCHLRVYMTEAESFTNLCKREFSHV